MVLTNPHGQRPLIILGASTIGPRADPQAIFKLPSQTQHILGIFRAYGHSAIDAVRSQSEGLLGETDLADWAQLDISIQADGRAGARIASSLDALGVQRLRIAFVCKEGDEEANPDWRTACKAVAEAIKARQVEELGLSGCSNSEVQEVVQMCQDEGWALPTVYRGPYNIAQQEEMKNLLPLLRQLGLRFHATKPFNNSALIDANQVSPDSAFPKEIQEEGLKADLPLRYLAVRWLLHHSLLQEGENDGLILEPTDLIEFEDDLRACDEGPLPEGLVTAIENQHGSVAPAVEHSGGQASSSGVKV